MSTNRKLRLWLSVVSATLLCAALPATAEEAMTGVEQTDDGSYIETMVVTGSRIPRAGFDTMLPATQIDAERLRIAGYTNAADALNDLPSFGLPGASTQGDQSEYSVGNNFVNFLGLGSQRTLTLVNGRRFVASNSPTLFSDASPGLQVDLNVIPASMIERIETIAVGGAPIYGADAIAGTVNVILKDDFEGFEISGSYGQTENYNDMEEDRFNLLYGTNFDEGRGNIVIGFEYNQREGQNESDRRHLKRGWQFREPADDSPYDRVLVQNAHANIVSNGGVITPGDLLIPNFGLGAWDDGNYYQFGRDGSMVPYDVGTPTGNAVWSLGGEGLFLPDVTALFTPYDRTIASSFANYQINDRIEWFGEFIFSNANTKELVNQPAYQSGLFGDESYALNFSIDHPLLTQSARDTLTSLGADNFWLQRSSIDLGDRRIEQELNLWRIATGFRGDFDIGDRTVNWEFAYIKGESNTDTRQAEIVSSRFFYALDVVDVGNGPECRVVADPASRPADPADPFGTNLPTAAFDDCVPLDIFGEGRASPEAIAYISADATSKTQIEQEVFSLNANADVFDLPAGAFSLAAGYERRKEYASFRPGGLSELGLGRSIGVNGSEGQYRTDEYYAEFFAPIISEDMGIPFLFNGSVEGAYRIVDNSLAGEENIWTIGGRLAPIQDIELRGNVTKSVRAPAITELFLPLSGEFTFANDPCDQRFVDLGPNPSARRANCIADGITDPDTFVSNVANASVQGKSGGNLNLENETADAWTVGAVLRPRFIDGLTMAIDYIEIDLEDAIESFTLTQIMESCYDQSSFPNSFCDQFTRLPNGQLPATNAYVSGYVNAGVRKYRGYTVDMEWMQDLAEWGFIGNRFDNPGALNVSIYAHMPREDVTIIKESIDDNQGEDANPDIQAQMAIRYLRDTWSAYVQTQYISEVTINNNDIATSRDKRTVPEQWLFHVGFNYEVNENLDFQINVRNLFDKEPRPEAIAAGIDGIYDNIGRYIRGTVRIRL
ncbi:MAG: TonB-dependent receptor [Pseudomonadales bacterium]